jgi:MFS family permease
VLALAGAVGFMLIRPPAGSRVRRQVSMWSVVRVPAVALCAAAVTVTGATIAMLEPILPLFFNERLGLMPARIGLLFGIAAIASIVTPFVYGPLTDRWGGRRLTLLGLILTAAWMPVMATATSFQAALVFIVVLWVAISLIVTPSLAYMAEVTAFAGGDAYGVGYGVYNTAWGVGLLGGPALGGWLYERLGFSALSVGWSAAVVVVTLALWRVQFHPHPPEEFL